jgi:hypothetical protein
MGKEELPLGYNGREGIFLSRRSSMSSRNRPLRSILAIFVLSMLACIAPGLSAPSDAGPLDSNSLSTIVAGTANAAATQTAQANPPTNTPPPSPTETATPTETMTPTPQVSAEGTSLSKQSNGSFLFTDYQGGYSVEAPSSWLVLRVNEQEFMNAWGLPEASDPKIQKTLTQIQKSDPKIFRLFGIDILAEHLQGSFVTNFSIVWDRSTNDPLDKTVERLKKQLPQTILNSKIIRADVGVTSSQIPVGVLEETSSPLLASGETVQLYQKMVLFRLQNGTLAFTLTTTSDLKDALIQNFDLMTDQIKMLP